MVAPERACSSCGKLHPVSELELSFSRPDVVFAMPKDQRKAEVMESDDLCRIGAERFFVRAILPLPVEEWENDYGLGVWVEVSETSFARVVETWRDEDQSSEPPFEAQLANTIPYTPETIGLPVLLRLSGASTRPRIEVLPSDHPLHVEQRDGISAHRASQYTGSLGVGV
jgi:hypothetical protein